MSNWHLTIIILCFLCVGLTIYRYLHFSLPAYQKAILITVRIAIIIFVFLAFAEPVFKFQRLLSPDQTIPVLIDASQSMNLFSPESTIISPLKSLVSSKKLLQQKPSFRFYLFGDSLREIYELDSIKFTDKNSYFPFDFDNNALNFSSEILLITDGNWSNESIPRDILASKNIYYHNLNRFSPSPYLKISFAEKNSSVTGSSNFNIEARLETRTRHKNKCTIKVYNKNTLLCTNEQTIDSGAFSNTILLSVPELKPGKHVLRIEASLDNDSLHAVDYAMFTTIPESFKYAIVSTEPSLNQRFLKLALSKSRNFTEVNLKRSNADVIFFLSWNSNAKKQLGKLEKNGIISFISVLPDASILKPSKAFSYIKTFALSQHFYDLHTANLPPPSQIPISRSIKNVSPLLSVVNTADTTPIVFSGDFLNRSVLGLAVPDFWKWDFWPISHETTGEESVLFSDLFINILKDMLIERSYADQYTACPVSPVTESDSIRFFLSLPSKKMTDSAHIAFSIHNDTSDTKIDTILTSLSGLSNVEFVMKGLSAGNYSYKSTLKTRNGSLEYSDTLFVKSDNQELMVNGQNNSLLKEFAHQTRISDTVFDSKTTHVSETTITEHFDITRTWYLLFLILLLILSELFFRQRFKLD